MQIVILIPCVKRQGSPDNFNYAYVLNNNNINNYTLEINYMAHACETQASHACTRTNIHAYSHTQHTHTMQHWQFANLRNEVIFCIKPLLCLA